MTNQFKHYPTLLSIAGSDSCGGAGIQADIKTATCLGVYAMTAITAITAQNTCGVNSYCSVGPELLAAQLDAVLTDIIPDAVKIGMIPDGPTAEVIASAIERYGLRCVVLDPVMVATSGHSLSGSDTLEVMRRRLLPLATVVTPNIPEAEVLARMAITSLSDCQVAARAIITNGGAKAVLLKGGHLEGEQLTDMLLTADGRNITFNHLRVDTPNTHGTGCSLSTAIASMLALGSSLDESCRRATDWLAGAIAAGADYRLGHGHGPVMHHYRILKSDLL